MMEEALLRFPHISDQILYQLNNEDYTNCREISKTFKSFIDNQKLLPVRIIEEYINFTGKWKTFVKTSSVEEINEIAHALQDYVGNKHPKRSIAFQHPALTPLQCAAMFGNCKILQKWLDKIKYSPSEMDDQYKERNPQGFAAHPLGYAALYGQLEAYKLIVEKFKDKNPKDSYGITPLHQAAANSCYAVCQWILNNVNDKHPEDNSESTPLLYAAKYGHPAICQLIINESKKVRKDAYNSAITVAAQNGHLKVFEILIGAIYKFKSFEYLIQNNIFKDPLYYAAQNGHSKVFECIIGEIKKGRSFAYLIENNELKAGLGVAAENGHLGIFQSIVGEIKKSETSAYLIYNHVLDVMCLAVLYGNLKICQFIIENLDENHPIKEEDVEYMCQLASENGHESVCEYFESLSDFWRMPSSKRQRKK